MEHAFTVHAYPYAHTHTQTWWVNLLKNLFVIRQDEFGYNAETQKLLCKNGETLLGAINFFVSSINTLVNKTMEDTLMTIKGYENAR